MSSYLGRCTLVIICILFSSPIFAVYAQSPSVPVKFGALLVLSGGGTYMGENCRDGMELAKEDINAEGGIRSRPVSIIYEDFVQSNLASASAAGQKLINVDHVAAIFPFWLEDTEILAPIAARARVPLMATDPGGVNIGKLGPYVFRATTTDEVLVESLVSYSLAESKKHICMLHADTAYFESIAEATRKISLDHGAAFDDIRTTLDTNDFKSLALRFKSLHCDSIFATLMPAQFASFVRTLRQQGEQTLVMGPSYIDYDAVARELGNSAGDVVYGRYVIADKDFMSRYKNRFGREASQPAGNCYDAVRVVSSVMGIKGFDFDSVNSGLRALKDYEGVTGPFEIAANGDRYGEHVVLYRLIKNGDAVISHELHADSRRKRITSKSTRNK